MRKPKLFQTLIQVRGYELDGYGHVNHAVYLNYAEYARWKIVEELFGESNYFQKHHLFPVIAKIEANYKKPCFHSEWISVETHLHTHRKKMAVFEQNIFKKNNEQSVDPILTTQLYAYLMVVDKHQKTVNFPEEFFKAMYL